MNSYNCALSHLPFCWKMSILLAENNENLINAQPLTSALHLE